MKKILALGLLFLMIILPANAADTKEVKPVKNLIVLIPDGTSLATVSTARWLQWYSNPDKPKLNIDPYLCGTVRTHSSNAPIGDSAPTTSCYMTGYASRTGYVSTYPVSDPDNDIYPTDPERAYQPLITVLEAAKLLDHKASGLVFTCEFPHATPADCSAHSYNRGKYEWIAPQMAHNDLSVVIGGGTSLLPAESEAYLKSNGYNVYKDDLKAMRADNGDKMWALFGAKEMDYDLDRNPNEQPSLEEMTTMAIEKLSRNENGFFLMVEGSKIDWAAHGNDPVGMATDFLAFDKACGVALDFARKNGETAVVILPDHGNSGISIGVNRCKGYDKLTKDQLFSQFAKYKMTAQGFARKVNEIPNSEVQRLFREYAGFELNEQELHALNNCKDYKNSPIPQEQRSADGVEPSMYSGSLTSFMAKLMTSKTCFGFTTGGHTGEEVFLAAYHPQGTLPLGMLTNVELNKYLCSVMGLSGKLDGLTAQYFAKHTDVFNGYKYELKQPKEEGGWPTLIVKNKKKQLTITPFTNIVKAGKKGKEEIRLNSVIVYVDKNNTFYLPQTLVDYLK
ncbi:alkaline phosphatase [Massilibacteroides sp.]|uniref:alkaline phosphatase n=1 Tax=Massilibacteroides sp. TaxID=2034766 RepID=UPI00260A1B2A|nr:alkaline phosphatase [Massilibacteroides sp.]MDD4516119.1 alkaline phosphatase [Massilibacteroides sp.]